MINKKTIRIYDGANYCAGIGCPVVDYCKSEKIITINDLSKPDKSSFVMTVEEYNSLVGNAKQIK